MKRFFAFPNPVDEHAARLVALGVVAMAGTAIALDQPWMFWIIGFGFAARVLFGPRISPLALMVTRAIVPALGRPPKWVPGPPKRFAQGVGLAFSAAALVLHYGFGATNSAYVVIGLLAFAAALEAFFGLCLGCVAFGQLMRLGLVSEAVCAECADIYAGRANATSAAAVSSAATRGRVTT